MSANTNTNTNTNEKTHSEQAAQITPEQALTILNNAAGMASLPRADHELIYRAVQILEERLRGQ